MNIDRIIELVKQFREENYKDLFGALIVFEKLDYYWEEQLEELNNKDIDYLEQKYQEFMENDNYTSLLNQELLEGGVE